MVIIEQYSNKLGVAPAHFRQASIDINAHRHGRCLIGLDASDVTESDLEAASKDLYVVVSEDDVG